MARSVWKGPFVDESLITYGGLYQQHHYFISYNNETWVDAKLICEQQNGHLVTISDAIENEFVRSSDMVKIRGALNEL